jgi:hypothetical protein
MATGGAAESGNGGEDVGGKGTAEKILRELLAISGIPDLDEIGGMERVNKGMSRFAQEERIVDGEGLIEERQKQETGDEHGRSGQAKSHARGLARYTS